MSTFSSTSSDFTSSPSGFWTDLRTLPISSRASAAPCAASSANLIPPALPRPPIMTWLLSTHEPGCSRCSARPRPRSWRRRRPASGCRRAGTGPCPGIPSTSWRAERSAPVGGHPRRQSSHQGSERTACSPGAAASVRAKVSQPIVLFDGVCNLCNGVVRFVHANDPAGRFRFASLQSPRAAELLAPGGGPPPDESVVLLAHGRRYEASDAVLHIALGLRAPWPLAFAAIVIPRGARDAAYRWMARNRYRWFGRREACPIAVARLARALPGRSRTVRAPWVVAMGWRDALFLHWPVAPDALRARLPPGVELDLYDGSAWVGVVAFSIARARPRFVPAALGFAAFGEVNVRTYVVGRRRSPACGSSRSTRRTRSRSRRRGGSFTCRTTAPTSARASTPTRRGVRLRAHRPPRAGGPLRRASAPARRRALRRRRHTGALPGRALLLLHRRPARPHAARRRRARAVAAARRRRARSARTRCWRQPGSTPVGRASRSRTRRAACTAHAWPLRARAAVSAARADRARRRAWPAGRARRRNTAARTPRSPRSPTPCLAPPPQAAGRTMVQERAGAAD